MLANITNKGEKRKALHPVVVINQFGTIGGGTFKIKEFGQLFFDTLYVVSQGFFGKEVSFSRFARGVTYHTCSPTHQCIRLMATVLEMAEHHHSHQVSYM